MAKSRTSPGWIKGIVKEVPSGDTLTIASGPRLGAPEKRITLASLIAPKLVSSTFGQSERNEAVKIAQRNASILIGIRR